MRIGPLHKGTKMTLNKIRKIIKSCKPLSDCAIRVLINDNTSCRLCEFRREDGLCTYCRYITNTLGIR